MLKSVDELTAKVEQNILRKTFFFLTIITGFCLCIGIGIGFLIFGNTTKANEPNTAVPDSMSSSFAEVAQRVEPAVVNIDTKSKIPEPTVKEESPKGSSSNDILDYFRRQQRRPSFSVGSGFIVDKSGYILTNHHVIDDASKITVRFQNGEEYVAKVIGKDELTDLAVLKIEAGKDLPTVKLGDSNSSKVGDWVLAIGSPFGLAQTVTAGIISQTNRETPQSSVFQKFIQTDAAINRGNSGGPLVNMDGEVIGVNSQIATSTGDYNGIGFALPSNDASYVYQQILKFGMVKRGYLGVGLETIKPEYGTVYDYPDLKGALITSLTEKTSPAAKAGLEVNDVITEIDGQRVVDSQDLISKIALTDPEKEITLTYVREVDNKLEKRTAKVILGERPITNTTTESVDAPKKLTPESKAPEIKPLGLTIEDLSDETAKRRNFEGQKGVIIREVDPASFIADEKGANGRGLLREGDIIQRVNRVSVTDVKSFNEVINKLKVGDPVVLHIGQFDRSTRTVQQRIVSFTIQ